MDGHIAGQVAGSLAPVPEQVHILSAKAIQLDDALQQCQASIGNMYTHFSEAMAQSDVRSSCGPTCSPCGPTFARNGLMG